MNAVQREMRGPKTESGIYLPSNRGYMVHLTLVKTTHVQARWVLTALTDVASWRRMERITSQHLRKWLGVLPSFMSIGLDGKTNKLQLPLTSLVEGFKTAKTRLVLTLRYSQDELIREAGIKTRTNRKWSATESEQGRERTLLE